MKLLGWALPSNRLMGCAAGWGRIFTVLAITRLHFPEFSTELLIWGRTFSGFGG